MFLALRQQHCKILLRDAAEQLTLTTHLAQRIGNQTGDADWCLCIGRIGQQNIPLTLSARHLACGFFQKATAVQDAGLRIVHGQRVELLVDIVRI